ncbi:alpha/beta fold hydrolase [Streptomyces sp. NPDC014864]|uniref:alpha/beta fold hydrolase n=1 Tax=Streptomyces sp. NPDC014864 TaxID=3364924 RepID=UPI0036FA5908
MRRRSRPSRSARSRPDSAAKHEASTRAFQDGRLEVVPEAGHLPQVERPDATFALVDAHLRHTTPEPPADRPALAHPDAPRRAAHPACAYRALEVT